MKHGDLCPWQAGPILANPIRKLIHNPRRMLTPYISEGMTVMDIGCGMGYFTIPMSRLAKETGKVIAVDLQREMLSGLKRKAARAGITNIRLHQCAQNSLRIEKRNGTVDFAIIFWMLHEVPDQERLIRQVHAALSDNGRLIFAEPAFHVNNSLFKHSIDLFKKNGFAVVGAPGIAVSRAALLRKT